MINRTRDKIDFAEVVAVWLRRRVLCPTLTRVTARQVKPVRLTVLIGATAMILCEVWAFYSHHSAPGTTAEERATYKLGEKAGNRQRAVQRRRRKRS